MRLYPELEIALDAYIAAQPDPKPSRPEAIRRMVAAALKSDWKTREEGIEVCRSARAAIQTVINALDADPASAEQVALLIRERSNLDRVIAAYEARDLGIGDA